MLLLFFACKTSTEPPSPPSQCPLSELLLEYGYSGLSAPAEIRTDTYGIPHIDAATTTDAFYASGYLQARDRLFQLDQARRRVRGTRSEVFGESYLQSDKQARAFGFGRYGCEGLEATARENPEHLRMALAWVAGVNTRIQEVQENPDLLPSEFTSYGYVPELYAPEDFIAVGTAILLGFSNTLEFDLLYTLIARTVPNYTEMPVLKAGVNRFIMTDTPPEGPTAHALAKPPLDPEAVANSSLFADLASLEKLSMGPGSNEWVVSGEVTDNGMPMLANDTHSGLGWPNTMWMVHMRSPDFNAAGFGFVGAPGVQLGHNEHLSWGSTTNWADVVDVWDVASDGQSIELGGERIALTTESHMIPVKQEDGSIREEPFEVQLAEGAGLIVSEELLGLPPGLLTQNALLANWVGFGANDDLSVFLSFDTASTLDEFEASVERQDYGLMNWVGASSEGIRYRAHGKVPLRDPSIQPNQILDGTDPKTRWSSFLEPQQLPGLDGSQPYIATANNDPWGHTADNDPTNDEFYYGSFYDPGWRADRISQMLDQKIAAGLLTFDDMVDIQLDSYSSVAARWLPLLAESVAQVENDPELEEYRDVAGLQETVARLEAWDKQMRRDSVEAAIFRVWVAYVTRRTLGDEVGLVYDSVEQGKPPYLEKIALLAHEEGNEAVLDIGGAVIRVAALADTLEWLVVRAAELGVEELSWGDIHHAVFMTPDGITQEVPADGWNDTINSSECAMWGDGEAAPMCYGYDGPILRQITRFSESGRPELYFNAPLSNEGELERWLNGEYVLLPFEETEIEAATVSRESLE